MAGIARSSDLRSRPAIARLSDYEEVRRLLLQDRLGAAYAIGDVDRVGRPRGDWYVSTASPALASFQNLIQGSSIFATGSPTGFAAILAGVPLPHELYFSGSESLVEPLLPHYNIGPRDLMVRMVVTADRFRAAPVASEFNAGPLSPDDAEIVNRLYRMGAGGQVTRAQIADGVYYGAFERQRLVALAGTHFISIRDGLAAVGNVFTHPSYRGRGLAKLVTGLVTAKLLERCPDVVLNVSSTNPPALAAYRKLGYREYSRFVELYATRRPMGPLRRVGDWLHRLLG